MTLYPRRLRSRLTLAYVCVLGAMLMLSWAATCGLLFWRLEAQLGRFSIEEIETVEGLLFFTPEWQLQLKDDYHNHLESKNVIERFVEVRSNRGAVLYRNDRLGNRALGGPPFPGEGLGGYSERSDRLSDGTRVRVVSRVHILDGRPLLIRLAHTEEPLYSQLKDLLLTYLAILPLALLVAWVAGHGLARRALTPIREMTRKAKEITPEKLHARLPSYDLDDELDELAKVFNETLARLERAFEQLRRFTGDVSHELRTPLAMMRTVGEVGLQQDATGTEYREIIGSMLEEVNRLTSLVENLLTISRADSGAIHLRKRMVPAMPLVRETAALLEILMEEKAVTCKVSGGETLQFEGDPVVLKQAVINLLHNAVKYSPDEGTVFINVFSDRMGTIVIEVSDSGPGIPPEDQSKVFDRFYRVHKDRGRASGGAGLGLSIAKWAVEAHGGSIVLTSEPGKGCTFRMNLPQASRPNVAVN